MKKIFLSLLLLVLSLSVFSQDEADEDMSSLSNFNEIKLNGLYLVAGAFDLSYERTLNEESGLGITVFIPFDEELKEDINFYISPYYRIYFGKKYAAGFFMEGFTIIGSYNDPRVRSFQSLQGFDPIFDERIASLDEKVIDLAIGIGLGGKWVTNGGFVGELGLGFGRNLFNIEESDIEFIGKIAITIGYRF